MLPMDTVKQNKQITRTIKSTSCEQTDFSRGTHAQRSLETSSKLLIQENANALVITYNFIILDIVLINNILQPVHSYTVTPPLAKAVTTSVQHYH